MSRTVVAEDDEELDAVVARAPPAFKDEPAALCGNVGNLNMPPACAPLADIGVIFAAIGVQADKGSSSARLTGGVGRTGRGTDSQPVLAAAAAAALWLEPSPPTELTEDSVTETKEPRVASRTALTRR